MTAALATGSVQPLHVFAWIVDSGLRDSLKSLAHALLRRVDRHTWRWPRQRGALGGVTVADLADGAGLSRRHAARCLRTLEEMGLVQTTFRPFEVSEYHLVPAAWRAAADAHRAHRSEQAAARREQRIARFDAWRRARAAAPSVAPARAGGCPDDRGTAERPEAPAPPRWATIHAHRVDAPPATVFELVGGAAAAILGDRIDPRAQGGLARPVLKLWTARGRPPADRLVDELAAVARWARESVDPDAVALRGQSRGQSGRDHSRDPRRLCDATSFEGRLSAARQHGAARNEADGRKVQSDSTARPVPPPEAPPWVPPGQPALLPGLGPPLPDLPGAWGAAVAQLRERDGQDRGAIDIFLAPLRPLRVQDGVMVVQAPSADCARWVGRHLQPELRALADQVGHPIGLVAAR